MSGTTTENKDVHKVTSRMSKDPLDFTIGLISVAAGVAGLTGAYLGGKSKRAPVQEETTRDIAELITKIPNKVKSKIRSETRLDIKDDDASSNKVIYSFVIVHDDNKKRYRVKLTRNTYFTEFQVRYSNINVDIYDDVNTEVWHGNSTTFEIPNGSLKIEDDSENRVTVAYSPIRYYDMVTNELVLNRFSIKLPDDVAVITVNRIPGLNFKMAAGVNQSLVLSDTETDVVGLILFAPSEQYKTRYAIVPIEYDFQITGGEPLVISNLTETNVENNFSQMNINDNDTNVIYARRADFIMSDMVAVSFNLKQ